MPAGPGKYDDVATEAREATEARALILLVLHGNKGTGFSVQATEDIVDDLPAMLRHVADEIERSRRGATPAD